LSAPLRGCSRRSYGLRPGYGTFEDLPVVLIGITVSIEIGTSASIWPVGPGEAVLERGYVTQVTVTVVVAIAGAWTNPIRAGQSRSLRRAIQGNASRRWDLGTRPRRQTAGRRGHAVAANGHRPIRRDGLRRRLHAHLAGRAVGRTLEFCRRRHPDRRRCGSGAPTKTASRSIRPDEVDPVGDVEEAIHRPIIVGQTRQGRMARARRNTVHLRRINQAPQRR